MSNDERFDEPDFIGPMQWDRDHLEVVRAGRDAINKWRRENPGEWLWLRFAPLQERNLERANLIKANLEGARLDGAILKGAFLNEAHLEGANLLGAHLEEAYLDEAHLEGANLLGAHLKRTQLQMATADGLTNMAGILVDKDTDMTGVGLGNVRIEPHIRSRLEHNIRRLGWEQRYTWYCSSPILIHWLFVIVDSILSYRPPSLTNLERQDWRLPTWSWWFPGRILWLSDYGSSSKRIVLAFVWSALIFAGIYMIPSLVPLQCDPIVANLNLVDVGGRPTLLPVDITWARAVYFSIVTMTTLGFDDVHANPTSIWGHALLSIQVVIGYLLLGALITRFAILFQSVE